MKQSLVDFLKSLPNALDDGTVLRYLFDGDKMKLTESQMMQQLVRDLVEDKRGLEKENFKMATILKQNDLYSKILEDQKMIWWEIIEDLGDGSSATRRFRTKEEALKYESLNEEYCYSGIDEVDTESEWFFDEVQED